MYQLTKSVAYSLIWLGMVLMMTSQLYLLAGLLLLVGLLDLAFGPHQTKPLILVATLVLLLVYYWLTQSWALGLVHNILLALLMFLIYRWDEQVNNR